MEFKKTYDPQEHSGKFWLHFRFLGKSEAFSRGAVTLRSTLDEFEQAVEQELAKLSLLYQRRVRPDHAMPHDFWTWTSSNGSTLTMQLNCKGIAFETREDLDGFLAAVNYLGYVVW